MRHKSFSEHAFTTIVMALAIVLGASTLVAQTTGFTYQDRLTDGGTAAFNHSAPRAKFSRSV